MAQVSCTDSLDCHISLYETLSPFNEISVLVTESATLQGTFECKEATPSNPLISPSGIFDV